MVTSRSNSPVPKDTQKEQKKTDAVQKDPLSGTKLSTKRIFGIATFFGVCSVLTMNFEERDREKVMGVFYSILCLGAFDLIFAMRFSTARWYWIHAFGNILVALTALPDLWKTLRDPVNSLSGGAFDVPNFFISAIHIYHCCFFKCTKADWIHHLVFAGIICPMGLFLESGPVANAIAFFICGLPGGLDYIMLALVKHNWMSRLREKVWNARINVWLRSTGLAFCATTLYIASVSGNSSAPGWAAALGSTLCLLNGQYYMQVVVGNTFVRTREKGCVAYNS